MARAHGEPRDFFISHASTDDRWARWIAWTLESHGWTVELDVWDWPPGVDFVSRMERALDDAERVLAVVSEHYFTATFARAEWDAAYARNARAPGRLIPVLVEDVPVPDLFASLVQIRVAGLDEAAAEQRLVWQLLGGRPDRRPPFPPASTPARKPEFPTPARPRVPAPGAAGPSRPPVPAPGAGPSRPRVPAGGRRWDRWTPRRSVTLRALAAVGLVVAVGVAVRPDAAADRAVCPQATELRALASPDHLETARAITQAHTRATVDAATGCPTVHFYLYPPPPGTSWRAVSAAMAGGWKFDGRSDPTVAIGPRPDLFFAESSADLVPLDSPRGPISRRDSIASSPIVAGLVGDVAAAAQRWKARHWAALLPRLLASGAVVLRGAPEESTIGALTTLAAYQQQPADADRRRTDQHVRESRTALDVAADATSAALLCERRGADVDGFAILASEQLIQRYRDGLALSPECGGVDGGPTPQLSMVPTARPLLLDFPLAHFTWTTGARARDAVDRLSSWLTEPEGRRLLAAQRLRPAGAVSGTVPTPGQLEKMRAAYRSALTPVRVLLVVDTSGSMAASAPGPSRLRVVVQGVRESLDLIGVQDTFGLWQFPAGRNDDGHRELVPFGPGTLPRRQAAETTLRRIDPAGRTPLYRTVRDAVAAARPGPARSAVVVLTDGEDTGSGLTPSQVAAAARRAGVPVYAVAVGEARCAGGPLDVLATHCLQTDFAGVGRTLTTLFGTLSKGQ